MGDGQSFEQVKARANILFNAAQARYDLGDGQADEDAAACDPASL
jgi:hypothetical protein